jgi:hypothetical protein
MIFIVPMFSNKTKTEWGQCYNFKKYFRQKIKYITFVDPKTLPNYAKLHHIICFLRETPIFRRKVAKIDENSDQNIDQVPVLSDPG